MEQIAGEDREWNELPAETAPGEPPGLSLHQARFLAELQVEVGVEIGELRLSAEQLLDLQEGQVFELLCAADRPVVLRMGGETIAQGRLVLHEERLCVEISSHPGHQE